MRFGTSCVSIALLSFAAVANAQNASQTHIHPQSAVVDGSVNPELIPDLTAYRLYLLTVSRPSNATDSEVRRQSAQILRLGISDADRKVLISSLQNFKTLYNDWIESFNQRAKAAWDAQETLDTQTYLAQRDQIVQSTLDGLQAGLSHDGWVRLNAMVKSEKKNMKISAKEVGQ